MFFPYPQMTHHLTCPPGHVHPRINNSYELCHFSRGSDRRSDPCPRCHQDGLKALNLRRHPNPLHQDRQNVQFERRQPMYTWVHRVHRLVNGAVTPAEGTPTNPAARVSGVPSTFEQWRQISRPCLGSGTRKVRTEITLQSMLN